MHVILQYNPFGLVPKLMRMLLKNTQNSIIRFSIFQHSISLIILAITHSYVNPTFNVLQNDLLNMLKFALRYDCCRFVSSSVLFNPVTLTYLWIVSVYKSNVYTGLVQQCKLYIKMINTKWKSSHALWKIHIPTINVRQTQASYVPCASRPAPLMYFSPSPTAHKYV